MTDLAKNQFLVWMWINTWKIAILQNSLPISKFLRPKKQELAFSSKLDHEDLIC